MSLYWGAHSVLSEDIHSYEEMVTSASRIAREQEFAAPGDSIVIVAGIPFVQAGTTNNLRVARV